jgi:hypothetical protein
MLDPRASAHPISDQAELLMCIAAPHFETLETTRGLCLPVRREPDGRISGSSEDSSHIRELNDVIRVAADAELSASSGRVSTAFPAAHQVM